MAALGQADGPFLATRSWVVVGRDMIRFTLKRVVDEPIDDVFDRLVDIDGYRAWMSREGLFRDSGQVDEGRVETGTRFYDQSSFGRLRGEVTELDRPNRVAFRQVLRRHDRPVLESRPTYELERVGNGTAIRHIAEAELHGAYKIFEPVIYFVARSERNRVLDSLEGSLS